MKYNTKKEALAAVKKNGLNLEFVSKELKDFEVCFAALHNNEDSLKFVPMQILKDNFSEINDRINFVMKTAAIWLKKKIVVVNTVLNYMNLQIMIMKVYLYFGKKILNSIFW